MPYKPDDSDDDAAASTNTHAAEDPATPTPGPPESRQRLTPVTTVRAATGVARAAWSTVSGVAGWGASTGRNVTDTVLRQSVAGAPPSEIRAAAAAEVRSALRHALGVAGDADSEAGTEPALREQGAALLRLSASPHAADEGRPAFARILDQLTSDEARVLRLLHLQGPQPSIELRSNRARETDVERTETGFTLIGEHAGLRFGDRVQHYLTNLRRLGLIEFTRGPIGNPNRYQLLEAQAPVRELRKRSGRKTKIDYHSVELTAFGDEFVRTCLPMVHDERSEEPE